MCLELFLFDACAPILKFHFSNVLSFLKSGKLIQQKSIGLLNVLSVNAQGLIDDDDGLIQEGPESETSQDDDDPIIKENSPTSQDDDDLLDDDDELIEDGPTSETSQDDDDIIGEIKENSPTSQDDDDLLDDDDELINDGPSTEDDDDLIDGDIIDDDDTSRESDASELVSSGSESDGLTTDNQSDKSDKENEYLSDVGEGKAVGIRVRLAPRANERTVRKLRDAIEKYVAEKGYMVTIDTDDWIINNRQVTIKIQGAPNGANTNDISTELASLVSEYELVRDVDPVFENEGSAAALTISMTAIAAVAVAM
jgi:hypothetical protein